MNENIKIFLQNVISDEGMQARMKSFTNLDEAYEYAKTIQGDFSKEEFTEAMTKLSETANDGGEISDEDLANVAGGIDTTASIVSSVVGSVSTAAAAAYL